MGVWDQLKKPKQKTLLTPPKDSSGSIVLMVKKSRI
jgi:hypothetical protein